MHRAVTVLFPLSPVRRHLPGPFAPKPQCLCFLFSPSTWGDGLS